MGQNSYAVMTSLALGIRAMKVALKAYKMDLEERDSSTTSQISCPRIGHLAWKKFVVNPSRTEAFLKVMCLTIVSTSSKDNGLIIF